MIPIVNNHVVRKNMARLFVLIGASLFAVGHTVVAQTRFAVRDSVPDMSKYKRIEECLVGFQRTLQTENSKLPFWPDTVELVGKEVFGSLPDPARDFAARCLAKFDIDSPNLDMYLAWISLYLVENNDSAAHSIAKRKLAELSWATSDSAKVLGKELSMVVATYRSARPYRADLIRSLLQPYTEGSLQPSYLEHLTDLYLARAGVEYDVGDSAAGKAWAEKVVSAIETASLAGSTDEFLSRSAPEVLANARELLANNDLLDSLDVSGKAYAAFRRSLWKDVNVYSPKVDTMRMIGQIAKPLRGDFVYTRSGQVASNSQTFPKDGKVSLIVFLYGGCRWGTPILTGEVRQTHAANCLATYTLLKRISRQYPELEITIASRTMGFIGMQAPLTPEVEAEMLKSWWLDKHQLPASLVITNTDYFRLPGLDGRRIDNADENTINYVFLEGEREHTDIGNQMFYLVDTDGSILQAGRMNTASERRIKQMLDIITKRAK